ncbi:MAG: ribonuclease HII [Candidatus Saccharibacteria bacterium]
MEKYAAGFLRVAGCDEVGVAPLAGPVVAATVILDPDSIGRQRSKNKWWYRVRDSKTVNEKEREQLLPFIEDNALDFAVGLVSHETIDEINIHQASMLAMERSVEGLKKMKPDFIFLDGIWMLKGFKEVPQEPVIGGDSKILSIAAASIVAKVARDRFMKQLHEQFPLYGFDKHKGYPTLFHKRALVELGATPFHRKTFLFVKQIIEARGQRELRLQENNSR